MVLSISITGLFVAALAGLVLVPKTKERINGIKVIIMGIMALFCYQFLSAYLFFWGSMPVGPETLWIPLLLLNEVLWGVILRKRRVQKLFFRITDLICIVLICVPVVLASLHIFTAGLQLQYRNWDAAVHFSWAMYSAQYHTLLGTGTKFSAFLDALFIQVLGPALEPVLMYKAFIAADIFLHILEVCMFYVLVITVSDKKSVRLMAPLFSLGYFWGYPAYSYMTGNFVYWSNGVMILILIIYALVLWEKHEDDSIWSILLLILGAFANLHCNKLFVPINSVALFATFAVITWRKIRHRVSRKALFAVMAAGVAVFAIFVRFYTKQWGNPFTYLTHYQGNGAMYRAMYCDIIFFLPALLYVTFETLRNKKQKRTIWFMSICMLCAAAGMYILWYRYLLSCYYYYKIYYNVWLCGWLLAAAALAIASEKKQLTAYFSCTCMVAVLSWLSFSDYDRVMTEYNETYNGEYATAQMFPLFRFNTDSMADDYENYRVSDQLIDVLDYAVKHCEGTSVWLISADYGTRLWGNGISNFYTPEVPDDAEAILAYMRESGVSMFVAVKEEEPYERWAAVFETCQTVYENEGAVLFQIPQM